MSNSFAAQWTVACQAPLSMEFSRQEYWSALPFPFPGIFSTEGLNWSFRHCRQILYCLSHQGRPQIWFKWKQCWRVFMIHMWIHNHLYNRVRKTWAWILDISPNIYGILFYLLNKFNPISSFTNSIHRNRVLWELNIRT